MHGTRAPKRTQNSLAAEATFRATLDELGATLLEDEWLGVQVKHGVRCRLGHELNIRPDRVRASMERCRACGHENRTSMEAVFRSRMAELGAKVNGPYVNSHSHVDASCPRGHRCRVIPGRVIAGRKFCRKCSGLLPEDAHQRFLDRVLELGGWLIDTEWRGAVATYRAICRRGHRCQPRPCDLQGGGGMCKHCGPKSDAAEKDFRRRIRQLGGRVLEKVWLGVGVPHRVICPRGHMATVRPNSIQRGQGPCRRCVGKVWDVFYVVSGYKGVKIGITSGSPKHRLGVHNRDGYPHVVRVLENMPEGQAARLERVCLSALSDAGIEPIRGREYFAADPDVTPIVIDIADGWRLRPPTRELSCATPLPRQARRSAQMALF